jgi:hypothetical protein
VSFVVTVVVSACAVSAEVERSAPTTIAVRERLIFIMKPFAEKANVVWLLTIGK